MSLNWNGKRWTVQLWVVSRPAHASVNRTSPDYSQAVAQASSLCLEQTGRMPVLPGGGAVGRPPHNSRETTPQQGLLKLHSIAAPSEN